MPEDTVRNLPHSGDPRLACAPPAHVRVFGLTAGNVTIRVESEVAELADWAVRLLSPVFTVSAEPPAHLPTVRVVSRSREWFPEVSDRVPRLHLDEERIHVLEYDVERVAVVWDRDGGTPLYVCTTPGSGVIDAAVTRGDVVDHRSAVRFLKFVLGARLTATGTDFMHGAAVAREGRALLLLAPSGGGKSSLSFNASTRADWTFLSDDLVFLTRDEVRSRQPQGELRVHGWPHRLGVSSSALVGHPARTRIEEASLRRHGGRIGSLSSAGSIPWGRATRRRVYLDLDEFRQLTGARVAAGGVVDGIVLPQPEEHRRGWQIEQVTHEPEGWSRRYLASTEELKFMIDFLGLTTAPADSTPSGRGRTYPSLERLPAVRVRYGSDVNSRMPQFWAEICEALERSEAS
ncbi:hypothetical protein ABZ554_30015 [Streptomyces sp. NPDC020125]|uniref:hypothetical protein n=1 Tax=Streptomyces sp. NPDC020125 TaxID=3154593 RepID=UPI003402A7F0